MNNPSIQIYIWCLFIRKSLKRFQSCFLCCYDWYYILLLQQNVQTTILGYIRCRDIYGSTLTLI